MWIDEKGLFACGRSLSVTVWSLFAARQRLTPALLLLALPLLCTFVIPRPVAAMIVGGLCMDSTGQRHRSIREDRHSASHGRSTIHRAAQPLSFIDPIEQQRRRLCITSTEISSRSRCLLLTRSFPSSSLLLRRAGSDIREEM